PRQGGHGLVAASSTSGTEGAIVSLFLIAAAAAIAPLLSSLTRKRVPDVVWLLILGVIILASVLPVIIEIMGKRRAASDKE
ncbi:MAG: hypothetical protein HXL39_03010, partial [Schaalia sp.]|nr:hypothetical protein [Schaalia sp.]